MLTKLKPIHFFLKDECSKLVTNIDGGHFDLTFWISMAQSKAMVEQKMKSVYLKYVKMHDYQLILKQMPLDS